MSVPLDSDGFMRRECPSCEQQFKWRPSQDDEPVDPVDQYFCPLCSRPADLDAWWTVEQIEHAQAAIMPGAIRMVQNGLGDAFRGSKNITFKASNDLGDMPVPDARIVLLKIRIYRHASETDETNLTHVARNGASRALTHEDQRSAAPPQRPHHDTVSKDCDERHNPCTI